MKTTTFFWKTREQCGTFLSWMHLTDGKIDLTRNHEALRVFHDLKPTFEQQIMDQTSNTQAQVSLTERNAAKQPLGQQKKCPVTLPQKLQQTISFKISISFFPALPLKPTEGLAPTVRHYPFTGLAWRMRTLVFSHTSERCTLEWSRATPPSVNLQSSIDDYETKFTKRVLKCIKMCLIQLPITHSTFTRASRRTFVLCRFPPVEDTWRYGCIWTLQSLFGLIDAIVGQASLNLSSFLHCYLFPLVNLVQPSVRMSLPIGSIQLLGLGQAST